MNYETVMEMQRICAGEKCELTRGQIAEETIDIKKETKIFRSIRHRHAKLFMKKCAQMLQKKVTTSIASWLKKKRSSRNSTHSAEKVSEMTVSTLCTMLSVNFL